MLYYVGVDGAVGDNLCKHGSKDTKDRSGGTDGDASPDEEDGEDAPAETRREVHHSDIPCKKRMGSSSLSQ